MLIYKVSDQQHYRLELFRVGWVGLGWGGKHVVIMLASPAELGIGLSLATKQQIYKPPFLTIYQSVSHNMNQPSIIYTISICFVGKEAEIIHILD